MAKLRHYTPGLERATKWDFDAAIFATDDAKARAVGLRLGMEISGTIGFLLFAIAKKEIGQPEANRLLKKMIANGYRSPIDDLGKI